MHFISYAVHPLAPWCPWLSLWHLYIFSEQSFMVCMIVFFSRSSSIDVCLSSQCRDVPRASKRQSKVWGGGMNILVKEQRIFMRSRSQQRSLRCWRLGWNKRNGWMSCFVNMGGWRHQSYILSSPSILPIIQQMPKVKPTFNQHGSCFYYFSQPRETLERPKWNPSYSLQWRDHAWTIHSHHCWQKQLLVVIPFQGGTARLNWLWVCKWRSKHWIPKAGFDNDINIVANDSFGDWYFMAATRITRFNDECQQRS